MKILFIAPLPPPITGQAVASEALLDELKKHYEVEVIHVSKKTFVQGISSLSRISEITQALFEIWKKSKNVDVIYLAISQSMAGNVKDLVTYTICSRNLSRILIHLHGGGIRKLIFDRYKVLRFLNRFFLKKLGGAIVLSESLTRIFEGMILKDKVHVVSNFADDSLFLNKNEIIDKFDSTNPLRILFLSNLIPGKGYEELLNAYLSLNSSFREQIGIDFAGGFESVIAEKAFLKRIREYNRISYHGVVAGRKKIELFKKAHIFCLPTYYPYYEGQPISILEAYAAGCVILTTDHGGISDIFTDKVNGYYVKKKSADSIKCCLEEMIKDTSHLVKIALNNRDAAEKKFNKSQYLSSMLSLFEELHRKIPINIFY